MISFKLNNQPLQVPTSWEEVTFKQYLEIFTLKDDVIHLVAVLTGQDYDLLKKATISGLDQLLTSITFINKPPVLPGYVDKCGPYTIPSNSKGQFNIQYESLGQFEDMRQAMMKAGTTIQDHTRAYGKYVAIYLQKIRDKEYDPLKVPELEAGIQNYPAFEVLTLGAFFFLKLTSSLNGTPPTSLHTIQSQKKLRPDLKSSKRNSVRTRR